MNSKRLVKAAGLALLIPGLAVTGFTAAAQAAPAPHGRISTVIGGPGGPAPATSVSIDPCTLKFANGGLYFASNQGVIDRESQRTGLLAAIAGNGAPVGLPVPVDGAPADTLSGGCGVTVDAAGNVLVADGAQVLVVAAKTGTFYRKHMTVGRVYTVASGAGWARPTPAEQLTCSWMPLATW